MAKTTTKKKPTAKLPPVTNRSRAKAPTKVIAAAARKAGKTAAKRK